MFTINNKSIEQLLETLNSPLLKSFTSSNFDKDSFKKYSESLIDKFNQYDSEKICKIYKIKDGYIAKIKIPGYKKEQVKVKRISNVISINAINDDKEIFDYSFDFDSNLCALESTKLDLGILSLTFLTLIDKKSTDIKID